MPNSLQFALCNATEGMDEEFRRWYSTEHLEHGLEVNGVLAAQMFQRIDGPFPNGKHAYMMVWEFDDPAYALKELGAVKGGEQLPISPSLDFATVQPPTMWIRAMVRNANFVAKDTASRGTVVVGLFNAAVNQDDAFVSELMSGGLAKLADLPGVYEASLLTLTEEQIRGSARKYKYGILVELADELTGLTSLSHSLASLPHADPERWLAPVYRPVSKRHTQ